MKTIYRSNPKYIPDLFIKKNIKLDNWPCFCFVYECLDNIKAQTWCFVLSQVYLGELTFNSSKVHLFLDILDIFRCITCNDGRHGKCFRLLSLLDALWRIPIVMLTRSCTSCHISLDGREINIVSHKKRVK